MAAGSCRQVVLAALILVLVSAQHTTYDELCDGIVNSAKEAASYHNQQQLELAKKAMKVGQAQCYPIFSDSHVGKTGCQTELPASHCLGTA